MILLNAKQQIVARLYASDATCTTLEAAVIKAGYSPSRSRVTASELRRDPDFLKAMEHAAAKRLERVERGALTDEEVVNAIRDIDEECALAGPVASFLALRLKANELLCKIRGMFIEKIEVGWGSEVAKEIELARERAKLPALIEGSTEEKDLSEN